MTQPDYQFGYVQRIDPETGVAKLLYKEVNGHLLSAPNDLVFDKEGRRYPWRISVHSRWQPQWLDSRVRRPE